MRMQISAVLGLVLCLLHIAQSQDCKCNTHYLGKCDAAGGNSQACTCTIGIGKYTQPVNCAKLIPKCWLMKIESLGTKAGRRPKPQNALVDNDGLYNPDCEADGTFKARQCNGTDTCWCVNSAGVRRTDKGDIQRKCPELVRTFWVVVQMKLNDTFSGSLADLQTAITNLITSRYNLSSGSIANIELENPYVYIDLKQNASAKAAGEVDIIDVGYYMEKDIKGDNLMQADQPKFDLQVNGRSLGVQEPLILYIDEKPHEISMKRLTAGVIAVIVVVVVAIVAGIVVLVLTRRKRGRYEKAEMKEMNEMQKELNS